MLFLFLSYMVCHVRLFNLSSYYCLLRNLDFLVGLWTFQHPLVYGIFSSESNYTDRLLQRSVNMLLFWSMLVCEYLFFFRKQIKNKTKNTKFLYLFLIVWENVLNLTILHVWSNEQKVCRVLIKIILVFSLAKKLEFIWRKIKKKH